MPGAVQVDEFALGEQAFKFTRVKTGRCELIDRRAGHEPIGRRETRLIAGHRLGMVDPGMQSLF